MRPEDLADRLRELRPDFTPSGPPEPLSGGLMNHVWRVPGSPAPLVVKVAPPYVAAAPQIAVDAGRVGFEARALAYLAREDPGWAPASLAFDPAASLLVMEDLGPAADLGRRLAAGAVSAADGAWLGARIGALHARTWGDPDLARSHDNAAVQATRRGVQYAAVAAWFGAAGVEDPRGFAARAAALGEALCRPGRCLVMGDLWPRSVLAGRGGWRVIDWEFSHFGRPAQDLGHLLAHLWMHADRAEGPGVVEAAEAYRDGFLGAYCGARGLPDLGGLPADEREAVAVHLRCEVLARTLGAFRAGYLYDGVESGDLAGVWAAVDFDLRAGWVPGVG